jgi:hypothetical protein
MINQGNKILEKSFGVSSLVFNLLFAAESLLAETEQQGNCEFVIKATGHAFQFRLRQLDPRSIRHSDNDGEIESTLRLKAQAHPRWGLCWLALTVKIVVCV